MTASDVEACELTTRGTKSLGAATGRSQASPSLTNAPILSPTPASELTGCARPQGFCPPAQPAGPAGGPAAMALASRDGAAQREAPSSLDTFDRSRPTRERCTVQAEFVRALEEPTRSHREERAADHRRKAAVRRAQARNNGYCEPLVREDSKWHDDRAKGQEQRISRVLDCGQTVLQIICQACGVRHERSQGCRAALYCVRCRGAIAAEKRGKFLAARADVISEAQGAGLLNSLRRGGAYGDKFLTLTVPHLPSDTVALRIDRLRDTWPVFLKVFNAYLLERVIKHVEWFRVIEWTVGESDQLGNPHLHLWLFAPYLDQAVLRDLWRHALLTAGCPPECCKTPIVDIRAMRDPASGAQELIKYLTKDIAAGGEKLPPELYAQVVQALDGKRQTQASKGFMARAESASPACECGSTLPKRVRRKPATPAADPDAESKS
jgi:hypothetical protein